MHRFFADEGGIAQGTARLSAEDSAHALRVLRLEPGDEIELVCAPERYLAQITDVTDGVVSVRVCKALSRTEARTRVTLFQGLPKAEKMEWIVQKATELGSAAIQPVAMERCVVRLEGKDAAKKAERWQKIAREAVKQCARAEAPEVRTPCRLKALEPAFAALDVLIVPWEDAQGGSVSEVLAPFEGRESLRVGILIGPEGGIAPCEAQWLAGQAGARLVTLGPRILRTETAALAALTMVMTLRGEME
ncbi:MAG: 16S rRNA (uracil(1498)-N(3))-methyltransferase [Candidatus Ventricola sp.]